MALDFDQLLINEAKSGDRDSAIRLLKEIAGFDPRQSPGFTTLICAYLAECVREWLKTDCDPRKAPLAFNVAKPANRPESLLIKGKHVRALRAYYLMRGRAKGREEAIRLAAKSAYLSESQIKKLLDPEKPLGPMSHALSVEQAAALFPMKKRVRSRCLNPPRKRYQRTR